MCLCTTGFKLGFVEDINLLAQFFLESAGRDASSRQNNQQTCHMKNVTHVSPNNIDRETLSPLRIQAQIEQRMP